MGKMSDAYTYMRWDVWREEGKEYVGEKYKNYVFESKVFQGAERRCSWLTVGFSGGLLGRW